MPFFFPSFFKITLLGGLGACNYSRDDGKSSIANSAICFQLSGDHAGLCCSAAVSSIDTCIPDRASSSSGGLGQSWPIKTVNAKIYQRWFDPLNCRIRLRAMHDHQPSTQRGHWSVTRTQSWGGPIWSCFFSYLFLYWKLKNLIVSRDKCNLQKC